MDKWFKDILPDTDPYHNRGREQMGKRGVGVCVDQHALLNFYSARTLKQQSAVIHVASLGHIILIPNQP
jgi:hypothetical protein